MSALIRVLEFIRAATNRERCTGACSEGHSYRWPCAAR